MDALYYRAATQALASVNQTLPAIQKAQSYVDVLVAKEQAVLDKYGDDREGAYGEWEPICIQMEDAQFQLGEAYGPFMEKMAIIHILAAAALEAHINVEAESRLGGGRTPNGGKILEQFDRLSLDGKWLLLPRLSGIPGFDPGAQPFQGLARLIRIRNALVHHKVKREEWKSLKVPDFVDDLGLTLADANASVSTACSMITSLAEQSNRSLPAWLHSGRSNFFDLQFIRGQ